MRWTRITSWALYDCAVTVFSMNVISRYFGLWVSETHGAPDWWYSTALAISTTAAALLMPWLGAISDSTGRRLPFLRCATCMCILGTVAIGLSHDVLLGLGCFIIANIGCQLGGVFYDALLPDVSGTQQIGMVSGIGVALGYVGAIIGLVIVQQVVVTGGYAAAFIPTACIVLCTALPCMLLLREAPRRAAPATAAVVWRRLTRVLYGPGHIPGLGRFLLGCFFALNAVNTVIMFMSVFAKRSIGLTDQQIDLLLICSAAAALLGALTAGWCADQWDTRSVVLGVILLWCSCIALAIIYPTASMLWIIGPCLGACLGATWTSARVYLIALGSPEAIGAVLGLFGLVGRASSNVGPLLWGHITIHREALGITADRLAFAALLTLFIIALLILRGIPRVSASQKVV
jgi:MFS transporter, UMF1 family